MKKALLVLLLVGFVGSAGAVNRSTNERRHFGEENSCPADQQKKYTHCKGYNIDHIVPICMGGKDEKGNMQWLAVDVKKAKDRIEKAVCACNKKLGSVSCPKVDWTIAKR